MKRHIQFPSSDRAFTLIELLVVVAIISLLVSILLPSLTKAKDLAKGAMCLSNLRNTGSGWVMYADDNGGVIPPAIDLGAPAWFDLLAPFVGAGDSVEVTKYPEMPSASLLICPANPAVHMNTWDYAFGVNYTMNDRCGHEYSGGLELWLGTKIGDIVNPSEKIILADGAAFPTTSHSGNTYDSIFTWTAPELAYASLEYLVGLMHNDQRGANFLWADGHASFADRDEWDTRNKIDNTGAGWWTLTE